jgi:hypothetical protein
MNHFFILSFLFLQTIGFSFHPIKDINNPTLKEYEYLDDYLQNKREFLKPLKCYENGERLAHFLKFRLIGENHEMPLFEKRSFNITEKTKNRTIILFASRNGSYAKRAKELLEEIEKSTYSGHVLLRIGGFPNLEYGGLNFSHIPYAFKVCMFQEAKRLGFKEVLWLDVSMEPLTNLEMIFSEIKRNGYFLLKISSLEENKSKHRIDAALALKVNPDYFSFINNIGSSVLGLDLENEISQEFLNLWETYTAEVLPCISYHPEDLSLSVAAWKLGMDPFSWIGTVVCNENEKSWLPMQRPTIQLVQKEPPK